MGRINSYDERCQLQKSWHWQCSSLSPPHSRLTPKAPWSAIALGVTEDRRKAIRRHPRLAGQRATYIYQQLASFAHHTRDAPFSKQYMWGAAANLSPLAAHALSVYFSNLPPRAANDGNRELVAGAKSSINAACRRRILQRVSLAMDQTLKALVPFLGSVDLITLISNVAWNNGLRAITGR